MSDCDALFLRCDCGCRSVIDHFGDSLRGFESMSDIGDEDEEKKRQQEQAEAITASPFDPARRALASWLHSRPTTGE